MLPIKTYKVNNPRVAHTCLAFVSLVSSGTITAVIIATCSARASVHTRIAAAYICLTRVVHHYTLLLVLVPECAVRAILVGSYPSVSIKIAQVVLAAVERIRHVSWQHLCNVIPFCTFTYNRQKCTSSLATGKHQKAHVAKSGGNAHNQSQHESIMVDNNHCLCREPS